MDELRCRVVSAKVLVIDLDAQSGKMLELPASFTRRYLGGPGLGIALLRSLDPRHEPLVLAPGLLVGHPVLAGCKTTVMGRSPLTGVLGEASATARWGLYLKRLGVDALVLLGRAAKLSILRLETSGLYFDDAGEFAGLDIPQYDALHRRRYGDDYEPARVGAAAERDVKLAGLAFDAAIPRFAARCGLGTLLARKGVKGISIRRTDPPAGCSRAAVPVNRRLAPEIRDRTQGLAGGGTAGGVEYRHVVGDLVIRNWREGVWPPASTVNGWHIIRTMSGVSRPCFTCPIGCAKMVAPQQGPLAGKSVRGPEYETTAGFGSNCLCDDPATVVEANELCDRFGLDTISVSAGIAFAMELFERGIIDASCTDGLDLTWGNRDGILRLIEAIARREGLGRILGEGTREAARRMGGDASKYAMHVRGLEIPYHDPRCFMSIGATYATAARGASHNESLSYYVEQGIDLPELDLGVPESPDDPKGKGRIAAEMQNLAVLYDSVGLCKFLIAGRVGPAAISAWLGACLGLEMAPAELHDAAQRIILAKRMYAMEQCGLTPAEDDLPERIKEQPRPAGGAAGRKVPLREVLDEYYRHAGFDPGGYPDGEALWRLGLDAREPVEFDVRASLERGCGA